MSRDTASPWELENAKLVYEVLRSHVGSDARLQAWELARDAGIAEQEVSTAVRWAILEMAAPGEVISSVRGPGGGYFMAVTRDEKRTTAIKRIDESRRRTLRDLATAKGGLRGLRGNLRIAQADTIASLEETLRRQERALFEVSEGTIKVGSIKLTLEAEEELTV